MFVYWQIFFNSSSKNFSRVLLPITNHNKKSNIMYFVNYIFLYLNLHQFNYILLFIFHIYPNELFWVIWFSSKTTFTMYIFYRNYIQQIQLLSFDFHIASSNPRNKKFSYKNCSCVADIISLFLNIKNSKQYSLPVTSI